MIRLPRPIIREYNGFQVVRDDLLPGGTKRRVIQPMVQASPYQEFVYASPACGYAQLALAYSCSECGKHATIFTAKRNKPHPLTLAAEQAGARIVMVPHGYLSHVQSKARQYAESVGAVYVPFGVDTADSLAAIAAAALQIGFTPTEVWTVSGSGTLSRGLQRAWPEAEFHTVLIGKQDADVRRAKVYVAPERFEQVAKVKPEWPACGNYDAKVWRFLREFGRPGALVWNVGR